MFESGARLNLFYGGSQLPDGMSNAGTKHETENIWFVSSFPYSSFPSSALQVAREQSDWPQFWSFDCYAVSNARGHSGIYI